MSSRNLHFPQEIFPEKKTLPAAGANENETIFGQHFAAGEVWPDEK